MKNIIIAAACGSVVTAFFIMALRRQSNHSSRDHHKNASSGATSESSCNNSDHKSRRDDGWMAGAVLGLGPAGGKSTLAASASSQQDGGAERLLVIDAEQWISWRRLKIDLMRGGGGGGGGGGEPSSTTAEQNHDVLKTSRCWEHEVDMTSLFFRGVVPVTLSCCMVGRVVVFNCINAESATLAGLFVSGIRNCFALSSSSSSPSAHEEATNATPQQQLVKQRVGVLFVDDAAELDRRIADRGCLARFTMSHFGYAWHKACHLLWRGIASEYNLPLVNNFTPSSSSSSSSSSSAPHQEHQDSSSAAAIRQLVASVSEKSVQRLRQLATGGFHVCHFKDAEQASHQHYTLVEVLPLQWALFEGAWPGFDCSCEEHDGDATSSAQTRLPNLVSYFIAPYQQPRGEAPPLKLPSVVEEEMKKDCDDDDDDDEDSDEVTFTLLEQSPAICAGEWGNVPTPFRSLVLLPKSRSVIAVRPGLARPQYTFSRDHKPEKDSEHENENKEVVSCVRVPMIQRAPCGYGSSFLQTSHFFLSSCSSPAAAAAAPTRTVQHVSPIRHKGASFDAAARAASTSTRGPPTRVGVREQVVVLYYGSFAPFHAGHRETLILARQDLIDKGFDVLGAFVTPVAHLYPKEAALDGLAPWAVRAAICQMCIADLGWAAVDFGQGYPNVCVESVASRLRANFSSSHPPTLVWINGTDVGVNEYMRQLLSSSNISVRLLFMPRAASAPAAAVPSASSSYPAENGGDDVLSSPQLEAADKQREIEAVAAGDGGHAVTTLREKMMVGSLYPTLSLSSTTVRKVVSVEANFAKASRMIGNDMAAAYMFWVCHEVEDCGRKLPFSQSSS